MKQGLEGKKTTLDDDAAIYAKRDTRSDKEKFKDMNASERWHFFRDYYLVRIIAIAGIAVLVGWILWSVFSPKPEERLNIAISETPFDVEKKTEMTDAMAERIHLDPKHETIAVDDTYYLSADDYSANMKFVAVIAAQEMDVMISLKSVSQLQVNNEIFADLSTILPQEILTQLEEYAVRMTPVVTNSETGEPEERQEGIYALNIRPYLEKCGHENSVRNPYVVSVPVNCQNIPETVSFICYLFGIDYEIPVEE